MLENLTTESTSNQLHSFKIFPHDHLKQKFPITARADDIIILCILLGAETDILDKRGRV